MRHRDLSARERADELGVRYRYPRTYPLLPRVSCLSDDPPDEPKPCKCGGLIVWDDGGRRYCEECGEKP